MSDKVFFDTSVLAYLFDAGSAKKRARAREIFERESEQGTLVLSVQVLQELYVTLTRKLSPPLPDAKAESVVEHLADFPVVPADSPLLLRAIALSRRSRISFWDALIIRSAIEAGCHRLYSEDLQDGWKLDGLTIENPFRA